MRDILTVFAILLVIVLTAALAVPYVINWNGERSLIEAQLSHLLGQTVKIRGGIDLKLLPTPYLQLANVEVADPAAGTDIRAAELHLEIALPALMRGEVDFVEARLVRPQLRLRIENGTVSLPSPTRGLAEQMQFERISVEDGSVAIDDPATGRSFVFQKIALAADAAALTGPFNGDGQFEMNGEPTAFRFSTGERQGNQLHFKLIVDENRSHPHADLDADLIFDQRGARLPSISGVVNLSGHVRDVIPMPWELSGSLRADLRQASILGLDLRLGDENHLASLDGTAIFDFGLKPRVDLNLKTKQLDLDKLLSAQGSAPPMQRLADAFKSLTNSSALQLSGLPVSLEWAADSVLLGGETLTGVGGAFTALSQQTALLRFSADGPYDSHLAIDGNLETGVAADFKGRIEASGENVQPLAEWFAANLPQSMPGGLPLPIRSVAMSGTVNLSGVGFVGSDLTLHVNGSALSGTLAYTKAIGANPARLFADLSAPRLEFDSLPDLSSFAQQTKRLDLDLRLDAEAVKVGGIKDEDIDADQITLKFDRTGSDAKLDALTVRGLDGADLTASGAWNGGAGKIAVKLDADRLDGLLGLLRRFVPGAPADFLFAHAGAFSPAHLDFTAEPRTSGGKLGLNALNLTGTAGQTKVAGKATVDSQNPSDFVLTLRFDAQDSIALLHQIGLSTVPLKNMGPGSITIDARGNERLDTTISALLAGTNFTFRGKLDADQAEPHAAGTVKFTSPDAAGLMRAAKFASPDFTVRFPADIGAALDGGGGGVTLSNVNGTLGGSKIGGSLAYNADKGIEGVLDIDKMSLATLLRLPLGPPQQAKPDAVWSDLGFAAPELNPPSTHLVIHVGEFDLWPKISGGDAHFDLAVVSNAAGSNLGIHHLSMKVDAGSAEADLNVRRDGASAAADGHLHLRDCAVALPSARGQLTADLDFAGTGESSATLIDGLAGSGTVEFGDLVLPNTDPGAMGRVFAAVEDDRLGIDEAEIDRVLLAEFGQHSLSLGKAGFDAGLAAGVLRLSEKNAGSARIEPGITNDLQIAFDLRDLTLDQESVLSLVAVPKNWSGALPQVTLAWKGSIADPEESVDASTFVNGLAARAIARESARIQAQEFDVHEHAFFVNRLQSERQRENRRLQTEQEIRNAVEFELLRKAQAARTEQKAQEVNRKSDETAGNAARETPLQIGRPMPLPPRRPSPAPTGTPSFPDPSAAGRY